jgi:hypothetical protein
MSFFNPHCVRISGKDFGRLEAFDPDLAHARVILGLPHASIAFLGQGALAKALRNIVNAIVMEAPATGNSRWSEMLAGSQGPHGSSGEGRWSSYVHPGFAPPLALDVDALLHASRGKFSQIVDDIEILQTDVEYMYNYVLAVKANINWDKNVSTTLKWEYVAEAVLRDRVMSLVLWQVLTNECHSFQEVCRANEENHASATEPGSYMAGAVKDAYQRLCAILRSRQLVQTVQLGRVISDMHAMEDHNKKRMVNGKLRDCVTSGGLQDFESTSGRVAVALSTVHNTMVSSCRYGAKQRLDVLVEALSAVQSDQRTDDHLSSLALVDAMRMSTFWGCQAIVESTRFSSEAQNAMDPMHRHPDARNLRKFNRLAETSRLSISAADWLECVTRDYLTVPVSIGRRLGPLLRDFCNNRWPNGNSGPFWLEKATKSREALTVFWQAVRNEWSAHVSRASEQIAPEDIIANMSFDISPQHLALIDAEKKLHQPGPTTEAPSNATSQTQVLQSTWGPQNTPSDPVRRKRTKAHLARTRVEQLGETDLPASSSQQNEPTLPDLVPEELTALRIPVKQDSLSVFNKMFSSGGTTSIRWIQLVQALTDAGMTATQVPGSGVKFANDRESIVLHKPHPEPVVDGVMLRCQIGRRLQKWFSWDKETFVLRVKNIEEEQGDVGEE